MNIAELEDRFFETCKELNVKPEHQTQIYELLAPLRNADASVRAHYAHSLRVGHKAQQIAAFTHHERRPLLIAGTVHDIGKSKIPPEVLGKTTDWTEADALVMEEHVIAGYEILRGHFDFSAEIMLWHHRFQKRGYPRILPPPLHEYADATKVLIVEYGRILALADVYDALHRPNNKFQGRMSGTRVKELMLQFNPDRETLVKRLYDNGIFSV